MEDLEKVDLDEMRKYDVKFEFQRNPNFRGIKYDPEKHQKEIEEMNRWVNLADPKKEEQKSWFKDFKNRIKKAWLVLRYDRELTNPNHDEILDEIVNSEDLMKGIAAIEYMKKDIKNCSKYKDK